MDKDVAKRLLAEAGLPVVPWRTLRDDDLALGPGRVRQWAEQIEDRPHPHLAPRTDGMAHGAVVLRCEHETDTEFADAGRDLFGAEIETDTGRLEDVGAARGARDRAVAVLGDMGPGRRSDEGRRRRDVEAPGAVAAGTAGIDEMRHLDRHGRDEFTHDTRRGSDLLDRLSLHAQRDQQTADLRRCRLPGHDLAHDRRHLCLIEAMAVDEPLDRCRQFDLHRLSPPTAALGASSTRGPGPSSRKFRSIR